VNLWLLWGKSGQGDSYHPLLCHMIDVGEVALALWRECLGAGFRRDVADWLGLNVANAGKAVAFWASLHDLGKASPAFQDHPTLPRTTRDAIVRRLDDAGLGIPRRGPGERAYHPTISAWALSPDYQDLLSSETGLGRDWGERLAQVLGGHHGAWPSRGALRPTALYPADRGDSAWAEARRQLVREMSQVFSPPTVSKPAVPDARDNAMLALLSGIVAIADWLGSEDKPFQHHEEVVPIPDYATLSESRAREALSKESWRDIPAPRTIFDFATTFGFSPTEAQSEVLSAAGTLAAPSLLIIESQMGSGKTEMGLGAYGLWGQAASPIGLYMAMPTMATSDAMHRRVHRVVTHLFGGSARTMLTHSHAALRDDLLAPAKQTGRGSEEDPLTALTWFLPKRKSLLWPFGVGTVDQGLMSVLQTKHFFVRLLGLSQKVVIFDEVHAYDTYMGALFFRLLTWLRQVGASVVVLSATLPRKTCERLIAAYIGGEVKVQEARYPRLTSVSGTGEVRALPLTPPPEKSLALDWLPRRDPASIRERLQEAIRDGGCAAVVCNTVGRAQELYREISDHAKPALCRRPNVILFHARFPFARRQAIERQVLRKFGRDRRHRPRQAIVVATQVIEQSLDLDFDVMISDLAPGDLLMQRAGRLHRHDKDRKGQPIERHHPYRLLICSPDEQGVVPRFCRADLSIYEQYVLLRTWAKLRQKEQITIPGEMADLVEAIYGDTDAGLPDLGSEIREALDQTRQRMLRKQDDSMRSAEARMVREPSYGRLLWETSMDLEEDDPAVHQAFRALTRDTPPSVSLVCLHQTSRGLATAREGDDPLTIASPDKQTVTKLLGCTVNVQNAAVVDHFLGQESSWGRIPALRYHRLAVFRNGFCCLEGRGITLRLSQELGLEII